MMKKVMSIGLIDGLGRTERLTLRIINSIALVTIIIVTVYTLIHILVKDDLSIVISHSLYAITSLLLLWFNYRRKYNFAAYTLILLFPISFIVSCIFLGPAYHVEYLLFITGIATIFLFRNSQIKYLFFSFNIFLFIAIKIYYNQSFTPIVFLNEELIPFFSLVNGLIAFLLIYFIVDNVFKYNERLNGKLKGLTNNQEIIIEERMKEIQLKSEALEQSNEEIKQFAYISAHDLREPLRSIMSFSQLTERAIQKEEYEKISDYSKFIQKGIYRIDNITNDIVSYTELEKYLDKVKKIDINILIEPILSHFLKKNRTILFDIEKFPTILMNENLCYDLFYHLIENGIQYCDKPIPKIRISCETKGKFYEFSIQDNGMGINKAYFDQIFMMFKRLHNDINKSGSGIGLAICKKTVTACGGQIWVESREKKGSTFYFTLPISM